MLLYDALAPNPLVIRLFILERQGLSLSIVKVDITNLENRRLAYRTDVHPRGTLPALRLDNGHVLTEITAICEYLDEVAVGGTSLFGSSAEERAETRMWLRRTDLEIAQPVIEWFRNDVATIDFYKGNRMPVPEARTAQKVLVNQFLNLLDDELEGKKFLCGERFSAADVHFYGLLAMREAMGAGWVDSPGRRNVRAYFERMAARKASKDAMGEFGPKIDN